MGRLRVLVGLLLVCCALPIGCRGRAESCVPPATLAAQRDQHPDASDEDVARLTESNALFGFRLARELARGNTGNLCVSPYSLEVAFGMLSQGARGETRQQIRDALGFDLPDERLAPALNRLDLDLRASTARVTLRPASSLWLGPGCEPVPDFRAAIERDFSGEVRQTRFPEPGRSDVNRWVEGRTAGHIRALLPRQAVSGETRLVLASALYLSARWQHPFEPRQTKPRPFHTPSGEVRVPTMAFTKVLEYAEGTVGGAPCQMLRLPYRDCDLSMTILLPEAGTLPLDGDGWGEDALALALAPAPGRAEPIPVELPRWELAADQTLEEPLSAMGMPLVFGPGADLSGMAAGERLFLTDAYHATWIHVDEKGTEAAASTALLAACKGDKVGFFADHPFLYLIRDSKTGQILFLGRVTDPTQGAT